jgi:hypothetical protein
MQFQVFVHDCCIEDCLVENHAVFVLAHNFRHLFSRAALLQDCRHVLFVSAVHGVNRLTEGAFVTFTGVISSSEVLSLHFIQ